VGLPDPRINYPVRVGGRRRYLDLAWPEAKVAVEFDGFVPHSTRRVFDDDRARHNDLVDDDWTVFHVTKTMLDADPVGTFRPVAAKVARNSPHAVKNARL
jgi:very-short-patch-repair endonuclease